VVKAFLSSVGLLPLPETTASGFLSSQAG